MSCYTYEGLSWVLLMYIIILPLVLYYPIVVGFHNLTSFIGILFITVYYSVNDPPQRYLQ
jgi:hypothetical protein